MSRTGEKFRYGLVAALCMATHNLVMIAADRAGVAMPVAVLLSFGLVLLLGFALHSRFTFAVRGDLASLLRYAAAMAANLPLTILLLWLLVDLLAWPMVLAAPVATIVLVVVNYFASRWAIVSRARKGLPA
jgi:putative flippase GtrA